MHPPRPGPVAGCVRKLASRQLFFLATRRGHDRPACVGGAPSATACSARPDVFEACSTCFAGFIGKDGVLDRGVRERVGAPFLPDQRAQGTRVHRRAGVELCAVIGLGHGELPRRDRGAAGGSRLCARARARIRRRWWSERGGPRVSACRRAEHSSPHGDEATEVRRGGQLGAHRVWTVLGARRARERLLAPASRTRRVRSRGACAGRSLVRSARQRRRQLPLWR
jgi:hypothetical protein